MIHLFTFLVLVWLVINEECCVYLVDEHNCVHSNLLRLKFV